jgi:hypothetical protein
MCTAAVVYGEMVCLASDRCPVYASRGVVLAAGGRAGGRGGGPHPVGEPSGCPLAAHAPACLAGRIPPHKRALLVELTLGHGKATCQRCAAWLHRAEG